jgi:hypothetical protein
LTQQLFLAFSLGIYGCKNLGLGNEHPLLAVCKAHAAYVCTFNGTCVLSMNVVLPRASLSADLSRIDDIAAQAGVEGTARLSVDATLAALPWPFRRRLVLALQSLQAFSPDPEVQNAAEFFQVKAARVRGALPFQGHVEEPAEMAVLVERETRRHAVTLAKKS